MPSTITVSLGGQTYRLEVAYGDTAPATGSAAAAAPAPAGAGEDIPAPISGKFFLTNGNSESPKKVGDSVKRGDTLCYIEAMKTYNAICADFDGVITEICCKNGDSVDEDDVILKIARNS